MCEMDEEVRSKESGVGEELLYRDPRRVVRNVLVDGLARELAGLDEGNAVEALVYAEERLSQALKVVRACLDVVDDSEVCCDDDAGAEG